MKVRKDSIVETQPVDIVTALPAGTNNIGDVDILTVNGQAPAFGSGTTSAATQRMVIASDQASTIASESTLSAIDGKLPDFSGTWGYAAGNNGTVTLTGSKRVLQITATALEASGTFTINGGDTITLPYGGTDKVSTSITIAPIGNLTDPTIVFSAGVDSYFIEYLV